MTGAKKALSAAAAAHEAALAAEALEREATAIATLKAKQEAKQLARRLKKQQDQDEVDVVAVGAVAHVIRSAFPVYYASPEATDQVDESCSKDEENEAMSALVKVQIDDHTENVIKSSRVDTIDYDARQEENHEVQEVPSPFMALNQSQKAAIAQELEKKHEQARNLIKWLTVRQTEAAQADTEDAELLSQRGLVIKAQIPLGATQLKLNEHELQVAIEAGADFGEFAASLLHAKTLVTEYEEQRRQVSGNGKKDSTEAARRESGAQVGYLETTISSSIRTKTTLEHHRHQIASVKTTHAEQVAKTLSLRKDGDDKESATVLTLAKEAQLKDAMNPMEMRKNLAILTRMETKLNYVKNPRFAVREECRHGQETSEGDVLGAIEQKSRAKPCFDLLPKPPIMFSDYDIGGIYEQVVYVRNIGLLSRHVRMLPPSTSFFSIASMSFPEESGMIAPGLHVELRLRFAPDSRGDYKDSFVVQYEAEQVVAMGTMGPRGAEGRGEMSVPLLARREPPELTLPLAIRAQNTLVGARSITLLTCKNLGGRGRFWLLRQSVWARLEQQEPARRDSALERLSNGYPLGTSMDVGPFRITPNDVELDKGQSVTFELVYVPSGIGDQREQFVMVCDNCLVRVFQLVGRGCQVDMTVVSVNNSVINSRISEMGPMDHLSFPNDVLVNARSYQTIVIENTTPLDVKYAWHMSAVVEEGETTLGGTPPFRITPESGVFPLSSSKVFTIEFAPIQARTFEYQATLMINNVPACSMPGPDQMAHLKAAFQTHETSTQAATTTRANALSEAMPGISFTLHGRGKVGSFTIRPAFNCTWKSFGWQHSTNPSDEALHVLQQAHTYSAVVMLENECDAPMAFQWDLERLRERHLAINKELSVSSQTSATENVSPSFELALAPLVGDLGPLDHERIEIVFTPLCTGPFSLSVPCQIVAPNDSNDACFERWLLLEGCVAKAEIEIVTLEVDFGLLLVGASAESSLVIRNPSRHVTTSWKLLSLDASAFDKPKEPQHSVQSPRGLKLRRSSSKESLASRRSSSSEAETERSLYTLRNVLPRATVAFTPESGELAPGETLTVKATCIAGSSPERFRGFLSCQTAPERNFLGSSTEGAYAVVSARAEIQCPNVFLSSTRLPLGTTYVGVEIHRTIELVNLSNLQAAFKFVEPEGASRAYTITFSPPQGSIRSKERLTITLNYTPRQVGRFTVLLACSVRGLPAPLGFELSSNHKGLVLAYELVQSTQLSPLKEGRTSDGSTLVLPKSPKEIALERGMVLSDCDLEPETKPLSNMPKLLFGDNLPLGEQRSLYLLVRNFSGIQALVDLEARKFPAAAATNPSLLTTSGPLPSSSSMSSSKSKPLPSKSWTSSASKAPLPQANKAAPAKLSKSRLSDAKDDENRFQTTNGRTYLRQRADHVQARDVLRHGRGVAFQVEPSRLHIPPWDQVVVRVTCFNNMPGFYVDELVSRAMGALPVFLHVNVRVIGTPLAFVRNCVGLSFGRARPQDDSPLQQEQPTLTFGAVCVRAPSMTKTLRVRNRGPQRARLKWRLAEAGRTNPFVTVTLRVGFDSRLQLRITPCDDHDTSAIDFPFTIEPRSAMIPAFSTASFRVTLEPSTHGQSAPRALLLADAHWYDINVEEHDHVSSTSSLGRVKSSQVDDNPQQEDSSSSTRNNSNNNSSDFARVAVGKALAAVRLVNAIGRKPGPATEKTSIASFTPKCLQVLLSADVIEPELSLDQSRDRLQQIETRPSSLLAPYHINFTTWSTLMSPSAAQHVFHRREVFLVNRLGSRLTFRLECDGPFAVAHADSLAPRHPLSLVDLPPAHRRSTAQGESYMFLLPPQMSVRINLRFLPSASLMTESFSSVTLNSKQTSPRQQHKHPLHVKIEGELRVKFATKSVQTIRLAAMVLRPAIVVSPSVYAFGHVRLATTRFVVLRLANPTTVPARFNVQHVPRPKALTRAQQHHLTQHYAHLTDEPSVFTFSILSGELNGPTTSLKSAGGWLSTTNTMRDLLREDATTTHPLVHAPLELRVEFRPLQDGRQYKSRFRFIVEHGRDFDVVLEGMAYVDQVDNPRDGDRPLVRVRELEHSSNMFRGAGGPAQEHSTHGA